MTRRHFELIASVLLDAHYHDRISGDDHLAINVVTVMFADRLAETNELFDRARFLKAAGVSDG